MRRVMVVGQPGSGKSTFAQAMGARTRLPVIHIDRIHWQAGLSRADPRGEDAPVPRGRGGRGLGLRGRPSATWASRLARADLLVWLDRPLLLRLWRVARRTLGSLGQVRPDMAEGCPERLDRGTLEFLGFVWRTRRGGREATARLAATAPCPMVRSTTDADVAAFRARVPPVR